MKAIFLPIFIFLLMGQRAYTAEIACSGSKFTGQAKDPLDLAKDYIKNHLATWGLTSLDVADMVVSDRYTEHATGITRIYFLQRYNGIPVHNAILNVSISKEGNVFFTGNRFIPGLENKVNATVPKLSPDEAVSTLAAHLGISAGAPQMKRSLVESQFVFDKGNMATEDIIAQLNYQPYEGKVCIAWDITMAPQGTDDKWSTRIDAVTGLVLDEHNLTVYCNQDGMAVNGEENSCQEHPDFFSLKNDLIITKSPITGAQYNVWPAPFESPNVVSRTWVADPSDLAASPYGWHDTDGQPGAEYTITRGNNVHAFQDRDGILHSSNDEPDGGPNLQFNFPYDPSGEPEQNIDAAVVNLFYWINYMHDFSYRFGFDEAAGNFQQNNYGKGGKGNDFIKVMAQSSANKDSVNNAFYSHALDGSSGVIKMRIFRGFKNYLTVNEPTVVAGKYRTGPPSVGWGAGAYVTTTPITGEVVLVDDGIENPYSSDACESILNASDLNGKIALIDRGGCEFGWKALQLQNAGAIGIICRSYDDNNYTMNPGQYGAQVQIPIVLIGISDGQTFSQFIGNGLKVSLVDPGENIPEALDSDLDNSMIAHEYAHGISGRMVGGANTDCLGNAEHMNEGWSDFFALAVTTRPGDKGEERRGFATYVLKDPTTGKGYRTYPYSTDMDIMPWTYSDVSAFQEVHDLGQVWCAALWDMYWALVDQYGWNANPFDSTSGNYRAIKLVMDGLKNTPCTPGFVDGRNAILAADESLYHGVDACIIWKVFARRGIGYSADQGSPFDSGDQKEAFDLPPACSNKLLIQKSVTDFIQPGDDIQVAIHVGNYKIETATNVFVTDEIPEGTSYKLNSSNLPVDVQANKLSFELGDLFFNETKIITYTLTTKPEAYSKRKFLDNVTPESSDQWSTYIIGDPASNQWTVTSAYPAHSGEFVWNSVETNGKSRQALELNPDAYTFHVDGDHPVLRFYHHYQSQAGISGGVVDVKEAGTNHWDEVKDDMLRHGYTTKMDYRTFVSLNVSAFSGNGGDDFLATYVDLSQWYGKDIQIRFRFGTSVNTNGGDGWLIDDIEFMDMVSFNGEACVMSDEGDVECTSAPEGGTIVDSREGPLSVIEQTNEFPVSIFPNPTSDHISIAWNGTEPENINVSLLSIDGRVILTNSFTATSSRSMNVNTTDVPPGIYLLKLSNDNGQFVSKVIVQR